MMNDIGEEGKKLLKVAGVASSSSILKALGQIVPKVASFASGAAAAGYTVDQILNFVKEKATSPSQKRNNQELTARANQGIARPDEKATLASSEQNQSALNTALGLGKLGSQAIGGASGIAQQNEQQAQEQANQQQQIQQQEAAQQQKMQAQAQQLAQQQQVQAQNQQRQAQQDQLATIKRQQDDIRRKEEMEFRKRAEERAIEKHKASMSKPSVQAALKKAIPTTHQDVLKDLYDLANRFK